MTKHDRSAFVLACLALFVALGGTGYAALKLPKGSVTTREVKDRSLQGRDFARGQLPRGAVGAPGQPGPQGERGARGDTGAAGMLRVERTESAFVPVAAGGNSTAVVDCREGTRLVGGGALAQPSNNFAISRTMPHPDREAWIAHAVNLSEWVPGEVKAFAFCAP